MSGIEPLSDAGRRRFLSQTLAGAGLAVAGSVAGWPRLAQAARASGATLLQHLGPLGAPDALGIRLPAGLTSRLIARAGEPVMPGGGYRWHLFPDGGATFPTARGGWIYVSNSEVPAAGGVGAVRFNARGEVVGASMLLKGTSLNCAGGATPWGTWLSCEEWGGGAVWECDPAGRRLPRRRAALGIFKHEAVAVDPDQGRLYLTEDEPDGRLYRFTPAAYPRLTDGVLEVAEVQGDPLAGPAGVMWHPLADPQPLIGGLGSATPTRLQVPLSTPFRGGEGIAWHGGHVYFTTKGDDTVWRYEPGAAGSGVLSVLYRRDPAQAEDILSGVDNLTVGASGEVLVAEDGGDMQVVVLDASGSAAPLLQVVGQDQSEIAGIAFSPDGSRLYFSSQRGPTGKGPFGLTYEIRVA